MIRKMGWGFGLAAALALLAVQAQAQSAPSDNTYSGGSTAGSAGTTRDSSSGPTGSATDSMGTGSGATATKDSSASQASGHFDSLQGKVQKFDRSKNTLTLSGSAQSLKIDSSTQVMKDGSRASLDDIKEGDQVRASYSGSGDALNVKSLDITSSGAMGGSNAGSTGSSAGSLDRSGASSTGSGKT